MLHQSTGTLQYNDIAAPTSLKVLVDPQIVDYYRTLLPKYIKINPQKYAPHISVIRNTILAPTELWGKYEGEQVQFCYEHQIYYGGAYVWLDCYSTRLEEIMTELGLELSYELNQPIKGFKRIFHTTIGNTK